MSIIRVPATTYDLTATPEPIQNSPQKILFVGQQIDDTSTPEEIVTVGVEGEENTLFGVRSQLATAIRSARMLNTVTQMDAIPYNDVGATFATGDLVVAVGGGGITSAGQTVNFSIQSQRLFSFSIVIPVGSDDDAIAVLIDSAINANTRLLVTSSVAIATVTLTSTLSGTAANFVHFNITGTTDANEPITFTWAGFSGGTGDPDVSGIAAIIGTTRYQWIVIPDGYDKATFSIFLDARFNVSNNVLDGRCLQQSTGTLAELETSVSTLNSLNFIEKGNKTVAKDLRTGASIPEYNFTCVAQLAAVAALRLTENQNIANLLVGNAGSGDNFGGIWTAAVPLHNTPFPNIAIERSNEGWDDPEQISLNSNGVGFFGNNPGNNQIILGDVVTTYLTDTIGQPDDFWKYLTTVLTASVIREFYVNNNREQYAQTVLTSGDVIPNRKQVSVNSFNAFQVSLYDILANTYGLVPAGQAAIEFYKQNLQTTANIETGTISTIQIMPINTALRAINGTLRISFDVQTS